ncbi:adenosylcobinamide-GDP ribazoletransferase [Enterococcus sp. PF1-24]|uniref:adenosylcobinamide-GDP ribazoletransferase n=1 Tax=unclassified Enterococcus TaxID=2608891 RepID=UPI002473C14D|nr:MULTISPECIES: adenosylcobinamide-GDP ribazoletransferase [unclassified Enterococcus]MDH6363366.1 adenosylcobinamide-GDP ribazoletransferase [Enterococcus sp. PFB1-1]MDH6400333.1 adenosylcobinamide-GDP ribazoletransferase [Enterococcus sp. PF1-24]
MIASLIIYFQFFTRIPIPIPISEPIDKMRSGVKYFSLFGLLIGVIEAIFFALVLKLFTPTIAWLCLLFFDVLLTGGFHLDALTDMADGLFSSRKKERMLEIMKDSRVGSNGVLALVFYYGFLIVTFMELATILTTSQQILVVFAFNLVGKNCISLLFYKMQYAGASTTGLGTSFMNVKTSNVVIAQLFSGIVLYVLFQKVGLLCYLSTVLFTLIYRQFVLKKVAGFNGDTLGAASPLGQVIFLLTLLVTRGLL